MALVFLGQLGQWRGLGQRKKLAGEQRKKLAGGRSLAAPWEVVLLPGSAVSAPLLAPVPPYWSRTGSAVMRTFNIQHPLRDDTLP